MRSQQCAPGAISAHADMHTHICRRTRGYVGKQSIRVVARQGVRMASRLWIMIRRGRVIAQAGKDAAQGPHIYALVVAPP